MLNTEDAYIEEKPASVEGNNMKVLRDFFSEVWVTIKEMLLVLVIIAAIILAIMYCFRINPDTVTIKYVEDYEAYMRSSTIGSTRIVSSKDTEVVEEWLDFINEAAPKRKRENFISLSKSESFPMYVIEFRQKRYVKIRVFVTANETVFARAGTLKRTTVKYDPINPFHAQAAELMAQLES